MSIHKELFVKVRRIHLEVLKEINPFPFPTSLIHAVPSFWLVTFMKFGMKSSTICSPIAGKPVAYDITVVHPQSVRVLDGAAVKDGYAMDEAS